jgi:hypothetical protein
MMEADCFNNVLELKIFLIRHKKSGHLFYLTEMANLEIEEEFDLFFYLSKPAQSQREAFPIPKDIFVGNFSEERLKGLYASYYCTDLLPDSIYFKNLKVYEGNDWVWLYENSVSEGF